MSNAYLFHNLSCRFAVDFRFAVELSYSLLYTPRCTIIHNESEQVELGFI